MKVKGITVKLIALICALLMVVSLFAGCNPECKHTYLNGVCTACKAVCPHSEYSNGVCSVCGIACEHEEYENGVCKTCGSVCVHEEYEDGECAECGVICGHDEYVNGICKICGIKCLHLQYTQGVCTECGTLCAHEKYVDGVCAECEKSCRHEKYVDGVCTECGLVCSHAEYENGTCKVCGTVCTHNFVDNKCGICGFEKEPDPVEDTKYDYKPHLAEELPRVYIQSDNEFYADATNPRNWYDNNNAANNIDWQYHACTVTVNNCDEEYGLSETVGEVKVRGNWTTTYPKKPFRIKFEKKQKMLGLNNGAKCKSWVLLADYKDGSLERNSAALYLAKQMYGPDGFYSSDFRQVELYLNGEYWGVYLLAEQQQVNENRINITEPADPKKSTDNEHLATNIGYFIEYDGYYNLEVYNERFSCNYSSLGSLKRLNGSSVTPSQNGFAIKSDVYENEAYPEYGNAGYEARYPQKIFIRDYMFNLYKLCYNAVYNHVYYQFNSDFTALVEYVPTTSNPVMETVSNVVDIRSLVDTYIHCEIVCDADIDWSSFLMDVDFGPDAKNNLLRFEAPWDFDSSLGWKASCESGTGMFAANSSNPWLLIFINESWFQNMIKAKWQEMTDNSVQTNTLQYINTLRSSYSAAYERNFTKWGFHKLEVSGTVNTTVFDNASAITQLYGWLNTRFNYLNSQWL